ncbi:MAG: 2-oxo acid dehydrogenase subunit E2, partial [Myroides sp.]|nr:2-oxo acid dehydrogenase subunit E2 [Myroides sp.]
MSILEMKVPSPGESITEVEIATWLVKDGDYVEKDQAIAEVDSDKATLELPAEESGIITLKAEEGDAVAVGQVVCLIDMSAAKPAGGASTEAKPAQEAPKAEAPKAEPVQAAATTYATGSASPAAKKILDEKNINPATVTGTGKDGRITKDDAVNAKASMGTPTGGSRGEERKKMSMLRRKVAERLVEAKNTTAMLTTFNEVNLTNVNKLRSEFKDAFKAKHGVGLGFMSFFTKAVTRALELYPDVNSMIDGQEQIKYDFADIS